METKKLNFNQRLTSIRYENMTTLMSREQHILKTLQNVLDRTGNKEYIENTYISHTGAKYLLNIVLTQNN